MKPILFMQRVLQRSHALDFLAPLALRLYLVPVFWMAGTGKLGAIEATAEWFGNAEWGLGLPLPALMAWLAALSETGGALALLLGLGVRWASLPLMATMVVAALTVHGQNGWSAIAASGDESARRLSGLLEWLAAEHPGRYDYITELGSPVMLNNGVEFAATYFVMLLVLFFSGGGRYVSLDYWLVRNSLRAVQSSVYRGADHADH